MGSQLQLQVEATSIFRHGIQRSSGPSVLVSCDLLVFPHWLMTKGSDHWELAVNDHAPN